MDSLQDTIKAKLFAMWLPDKPGGLAGLIELAAQVAAEAVEGIDLVACDHVEELEGLYVQVADLTEHLHYSIATVDALVAEEEGKEVSMVQQSAEEQPDALLSATSGPVSQYDCSSCGHSHKVDSRIGKEHLPRYNREQVEKNVEPVAPYTTSLGPKQASS